MATNNYLRIVGPDVCELIFFDDTSLAQTAKSFAEARALQSRHQHFSHEGALRLPRVVAWRPVRTHDSLVVGWSAGAY